MPTNIYDSTPATNALWDSIFSPTAEPVVAPVSPADITPVLDTTTPAVPDPNPPITEPVAVLEDVEDALFPEAGKLAEAPKAEPVKPGKPAKPEATEPEPDEEAYTRQVFKNAASKLIANKTWEEIDDFDNWEPDEDSFQDMLQQQVENRIGQAWEQVKQSDEVVARILSVIEAGGNPDSIIDLFKEQKQLRAIDSTTPEGKLEVIGKFYSEVVKLSPAKVKEKLKRLETGTDEDIQAEFSLADERYQEHFTAEQDRIKQTELAKVQQIENQKRAQVNATYQALLDQKTHEATAKKIIRDIYQPVVKMPDGEVISDFDYKLLQVRNDPKKNLELARFIMDPDGFIKSKTVEATNQVTETTFGKLKFKPSKTSTGTTGTPVAAGGTDAIRKLYTDL